MQRMQSNENRALTTLYRGSLEEDTLIVAFNNIKKSKEKKHLYKLVGKKLPEREDDAWYSIFPVENEQLVYGR